VASALSSLGRSSWAGSLLAQLVGNQLSSQLVSDLVVTPDLLSEDAPLPISPTNLNYIAQLFVAPNATPSLTVAVLLAETTTFGSSGLEKTLLYKVLRHATLREAARAAAIKVGAANAPRLLDLELIGIRGAATAAIVATYAQLLTRTDFAVSGGKPLGDFMRGQPEFDQMRLALSTLRDTPTAELDRLFPETLDLASHRLDAWITALATSRLQSQRSGQLIGTEGSYPLSSGLGGYAMVENVRPASSNAPSGGFIQTPSMAHASAAAVLRNGYLSYRAEDPQKYAIDLSSERVRAARATLDEVRSGQPLGAVLGQRFERRLGDRNPGANQYRYALRRYFPLVAAKATALAPGESADTVAARNVVDGLRLFTAFNAGQIPFTTAPDLPNPNSTNPTVRQAYLDIAAEITALQDPIDAVADLVISESVYQLTRGNVGSAAGNLDALARGSSPPDPEISRSVRQGVGVTERIALVFPAGGQVDAPQFAPDWTTTLTPRATAEPLLDNWAGGLLGKPTQVSCAVRLKDAAGVITTVTVKLSDLSFDGAGAVKLRPLDVLSLARAAASANQGSLLDRYIAAAAVRGQGSRQVDQIDYTRQGTDRTFPEAMAIAYSIVDLLAGARALAPSDLAVPSETTARRDEVETEAKTSAQSVLDRATAAQGALVTIRQDLFGATAGGVRDPLEAAAAYIPFARPAAGADEAALSQSQGPILAEIDRRLAAFDAVPAPGTDAASIAAAATEKLRVLFGRELLPLPAFPPPADGEIDQSLGARHDLLGGDDPAPIAKFLQRAGQVQPGLGRWRMLSLALRASAAPQPRTDVAQLPFAAGERWAALPFAGAAQPRGRTAFTLFSYGTAAPAAASTEWRGVMLDEWMEIVPQPSEQTGVAFHFDYPIAEAGQSILIAVPSSAGANWSYDDILATLNETLDLAKIRAVDAERLELGQFLPTAYLAKTLHAATVSTGWGGLLRVLTTGASS
jgi:hypothetical protein